MTIWAVLPAYDKEDNICYQVLPYDFKGTVKCHFKFYKGLFTLIPFLLKCRATEESANKLAKKLADRNAFG